MAPRTSAFNVFATVFFGEFADAAAVDVLKFEDEVELLFGETFGNVDCAVGVAHCDDLGAERKELLGGVGSHVTRAGDSHFLAFDVDAASCEHVEQEVYVTVAGSFGAYERAAEFEAFAGESSGEFASHLLVHTVHIAHFATAYADVAGRNIGVGTDVAPQFGNECLAEAHHFHIRLAFGAEVATAFTAAHRERGERVLESLLEGEEFKYRLRD